MNLFINSNDWISYDLSIFSISSFIGIARRYDSSIDYFSF